MSLRDRLNQAQGEPNPPEQPAENGAEPNGEVHEAPVTTPVRRLDEARAARHLRLRW